MAHAHLSKPSRQKLSVGSDHAGYLLKMHLLKVIRAWGHDLVDCGSYNPEPVDFPDIAATVCQGIVEGRAIKAILVCGTDIGASMAANKIRGIRAALCHDTYSAHQCVEHDDANVLCLGAQVIGPKLAEEILQAFLSAQFSTAEEFRRRVRKLMELEKRK